MKRIIFLVLIIAAFGLYSAAEVNFAEPVEVRKGFRRDIKTQMIVPDENGTINIKIREMERIEIQLSPVSSSVSPVVGYQIVGEQLRSLPIGSTFDVQKGTFYWLPGPGYLGEYRLVFIDEDNHLLRKINIEILKQNG